MNTIPMEKRDPNKTYAKLLQELRDFLRMDKAEFATHLGVTINTLDAWMYRGTTPRSSMRRKIERIASGHGLTIPK